MEAQAITVEKPVAAAEEKFSELTTRLSGEESRRMTHSELESLITVEGREIHRRLLQGHLDLCATEEQVQASVRGTDGVERTHHRRRARGLLTVFGLVAAMRMTYGARRHGSLSPLDASLNLPEELHSHGLRRLAAVEAVRGSFDATVEAVERNTGTRLAKRQAEELVARAAQDFDAFYDRPESAQPATTEDLLVLSLDGKGIVMRTRTCGRRRARQQRAHNTSSTAGCPRARRGIASAWPRSPRFTTSSRIFDYSGFRRWLAAFATERVGS